MRARVLSPSRALSPPTPPKKEALTGRTTPVFFSSTDPKSPPTPLRVAPHRSWRGPAVVAVAAGEAAEMLGVGPDGGAGTTRGVGVTK